MRSRFCLFSILLGLLLPFVGQGEARTWTSSDGKTIEGTLLDFDGESVKLKTERGVFDLALSRLAEADQKFVKQWAQEKEEMAKEESQSTGTSWASEIGNFDGLTLGEWPQFVTAELDLDDIVTVEGEALAEIKERRSESEVDDELFVYRTPHFEFHAPDRLSASVIREFARIFEATYQFVDQMPIGLAPKPSSNGFYQTKLYMSRNDYYAAGGSPGSGGMMSWRRRGNEMSSLIQVPLPNLGVEYTGTRFIVDHDKRSTTLTHEITHQVMMLWLMTPMPTWLSEGIAEVVSCQDYDNGRFKLNSMNRAIVEDVTRGQGRDFSMLDLNSLMNISDERWSSDLASGKGGLNYRSSNVLAYYFLRLDGEGDASHLVEFLKELPAVKRGDDAGLRALQEKHLLRGRSFEEMEEEVAKAWRSEGLQIEFLPSRSD